MKLKVSKQKFIRVIAIEILAAGLIFVGMLFYAQRFDFQGTMDALFVAGFLFFITGWLMFVTDFGIFDISFYGVKQFTLALVGKRPKKSLEETLYNKEKLPPYIYVSLWITGLVVMAGGLIMYYIYYTQL